MGYYMKKITILLLLISSLFADDFLVKSFQKVENDLSARKYVEYDINGDACALIKVKTDIEKVLQFDSNMGIPVAPVKKEPGEYWVYVAEGERALKCMAESFIPKTISLESAGKITSLNVYELFISSKQKNIQSLPVTFLTEPEETEKWIDGKLLGTGINYNIALGKHELTVKKAGYKDYIQDIEIDAQHVIFKDIVLQDIELMLVTVNTTPGNASLFLNDVQIGNTSWQEFLAPGTYQLMLSKSGYSTLKKKILVKEGVNNTFQFDLQRYTGRVKIDIFPPEAQLMVDNVLRDSNSPITLNPGTHKVRVSCPGYDDISENIMIDQGQDMEKSYRLERKVGSLQFSVQPVNAKVTMKNTKGEIFAAWEGANYLKNIPIGTYDITIECEGYESATQRVMIAQDKKSPLRVTLIDPNAEDEEEAFVPFVAPTLPQQQAEQQRQITEEQQSDRESDTEIIYNPREDKLRAFIVGAEFGPVTLGGKLAYRMSERSTLGTYALLRPFGAAVMLSYERHSSPKNKLRFNYGLGFHGGYAFIEVPGATPINKEALGIDAIIGIKYALGNFNVGLQYQPGYDFIGGWVGNLYDVNLIMESEL